MQPPILLRLLLRPIEIEKAVTRGVAAALIERPSLLRCKTRQRICKGNTRDHSDNVDDPCFNFSLSSSSFSFPRVTVVMQKKFECARGRTRVNWICGNLQKRSENVKVFRSRFLLLLARHSPSDRLLQFPRIYGSRLPPPPPS
jgi:hypothetical protein